MESRWISYNGIAGSIQEDLEVIMLYSEPTKGVTIADIYSYTRCICLAYSKIIAVQTGKSVNELANAIFSQNADFYGKILHKAFENSRYISMSKAEELLTKFLVPVID